MSQWLNKRAVLNDLAEVTGTYGCGDGLTSIHDRPPNHAEELDDEQELYLSMCSGGRRGRDVPPDNNNMQPDLNSISFFLQRVHETENLPDHNEPSFVTNLKSRKLVISKLNPHVKEFVPKAVFSANNNITSENNVQSDKSKDAKRNGDFTPQIAQTEVKAKDVPEIDALKDTDDGVLSKNEDLHEEVTSHERDGAGAVEPKKNRFNVAMASIMGLPMKQEIQKKTIKLLTPDDFSLNPDVSKKTIDMLMAKNIEDFQKTSPVLQDRRFLPGPSENHLEAIDKKEKVVKVDVKEKDDIVTLGNTNLEYIPKEIQESIKKVDSWLGGEDKALTAPAIPKAPFLGKVTFAKKQTTTPSKLDVAPTSDPRSAASSNSSSPAPKQYKPSPYAEKLLKKYEKNVKSEVVVEDVWSQAMRLMKEKDEKKRKEKLESELASGSAELRQPE